jgi:hypothetical protein
MKKIHIAACIAFLAICGAASAQQKPCSKADSANAEKAIDRVTGWPQLQKAWQDFRHCDAGPVDEQFTEALLRLIVDWKDIPAFAAAFERDEGYREFILRHIKSPAAKDDGEAIYSRAKASCPPKHEKFCAEIAEAAKPGSAPARAAPAATPPAVPMPVPAPAPATPTAK